LDLSQLCSIIASNKITSVIFKITLVILLFMKGVIYLNASSEFINMYENIYIYGVVFFLMYEISFCV